MKDLFLGSGFERNPAGQAMIRLTAPVGFALLVLVAIVFLSPIGSMFAEEQSWLPPGFKLLLCGGIALVVMLILWAAIRSRVLVIVDPRMGVLTVRSREGRVEYPTSKVASASTGSRGTPRGRRYRLELVLRSEERVAVTADYFPYSERDCARVINAINRELG